MSCYFFTQSALLILCSAADILRTVSVKKVVYTLGVLKIIHIFCGLWKQIGVKAYGIDGMDISTQKDKAFKTRM